MPSGKGGSVNEFTSLFGVSVCGVMGVVDSGMVGIDKIGESISEDHGWDLKKLSNSEPELRLRLVRRLAGISGKDLVFRVPVLERRFNCLRRSIRGRLGATYRISASSGMGGASGAIENMRCKESRGSTVESERVSPTSESGSIGIANVLDIRARARVVPDIAEDAGVSLMESLEVSIVRESRGSLRGPSSVRSSEIGGETLVGDMSWIDILKIE